MTKIFLATGNKKKIDEMGEIINSLGLDIELLSIKDGIEIPEVVEDLDTFEGNSAKKAVEIAKHLNMITISDDSGLCVEVLNGAPGVYSARFAGENATDSDNNKKLIETLKSLELEQENQQDLQGEKSNKNRNAKFVCVISLGKPDGTSYSFRGELQGEIVDDARGENGFGYDPHFYILQYDKTLAQIPEIKKEISHRAMALKKLSLEIKKYI